MKYEITYTESYAKTYIIEANSRDEAVEKVEEGIRNGDLDGPDQCYDSNYYVTEAL